MVATAGFICRLKFVLLFGLALLAVNGRTAEVDPAAVPPPEPSFVFPIVSEPSHDAHDALIADARFIEGERTLLTIDHFDDVKLWDVATGALKASYRFGPGQYVNHISLSPNEALLAIATRNGRMVVMELASGKIIWELFKETGFPCADFHPEGKWLLASDGSSLAAYDGSTGKLMKQFARNGLKRWPREAEFISSERFITFSEDGELTIWNWMSGMPEPKKISVKSPYSMATLQIVREPELQVVINPAGGSLCRVSLTTGAVQMIDTGSQKVSSGWDLALSQHVLITPSVVLDFPSGKFLGKSGIAGFETVRVSPSGKYLAALSRTWRIYRLPEKFENLAKK